MRFIRPEIEIGLLRWRETLAGFGVAALGLYFAVLGWA